MMREVEAQHLTSIMVDHTIEDEREEAKRTIASQLVERNEAAHHYHRRQPQESLVAHARRKKTLAILPLALHSLAQDSLLLLPRALPRGNQARIKVKVIHMDEVVQALDRTALVLVQFPLNTNATHPRMDMTLVVVLLPTAPHLHLPSSRTKVQA